VEDGDQQLLGRTIGVTNADKVLFPEDGITKGELIEYQVRVADVAFRYIEDRPIALKRFPDGLGGEGFFQKARAAHYPAWVGSVEVGKRGGGTTDNVVASEPAVLPFLAQQGTVELHTWLSHADDLDHPDQLVIDLDPPGDDVDAARRATRRVREVLDELELPSLLKTSGSKGYHVHVLLDGSVRGDDARRLGAEVADLLARRHPDELTDEHRKDARRGRVLVDHFRNGFAQTVVAPYSPRARPGAPVSTPIDWSELGDVDPRRFTVGNLFRRLGQRDDPWAAGWGQGTDLTAARSRLDELLAEVG
jgi:bifunctional non-homologous end joining protein LigD